MFSNYGFSTNQKYMYNIRLRLNVSVYTSQKTLRVHYTDQFRNAV